MTSPASRAAVITANYGEAGALDLLGGVFDLPPVYSGQNELWYRGRPTEGTATIVAVGYSPERLSGVFASCTAVRQMDNRVDIPNEEQGPPITACRGPRGSWAQLWPGFQHYS